MPKASINRVIASGRWSSGLHALSFMRQDRWILLCLLTLIPFSALTQKTTSIKRDRETEGIGAVQREVDSLKSVLKVTPSKRDKAEVYGQLCTTYVGMLGDVGIGRLYADSIKMLADALASDALSATSNYYYGIVERYEGKYSDALDHFQRQLDYCKDSGDSSMMAGTLFQMAVVHQNLGNYEESLAVSYRAIQLYERDGPSLGLAGTFMHIGNLFGRLKKSTEAIAMHKRALTVFDSVQPALKVNLNKQRALINLANAYKDLKQYDTARTFYNQALAISRELGSSRTTATSLSNIGAVLFALKKYDSALVYQMKALAIREKTSQKDKVPISLVDVGDTYMMLGDNARAIEYLSRGLSLAKEFELRPLIRNAYEKLSAFYSIQGNYAKAYEYHRLFTTVKDSILSDETAQQLRELQTKYEAGEKDKAIVVLAKATEIQKKEAERQATLTWVFAAGAGSVVVLILLLFYMFRQRWQLMAQNDKVKEAEFKREVSELEMKALRAQINPHFLFNCMNAINLMILKGRTESASLYLEKFSSLVRLILESAERSAVTLASEMSLLESYLQLEELRLPGRLGYKISVDEAIGVHNTYLPSMLLQPVVENAIWHGIVHKANDEKGNIQIDVKQLDDQLLCTIEDDGVGREEALKLRDKTVSRKSLGMKITEARLQLRRGKRKEQCIQITDLKDTSNRAVGTRVTIQIPIC